MNNKNSKSLDDLEIGVKHLLLENRYSLSDEDKVLLNECLDVIQEAKGGNNIEYILNILIILARLFLKSHELNDNF
jgi:hypothetical protein